MTLQPFRIERLAPLLLLLLLLAVPAQAATLPSLDNEVESLLNVVSVVGREEPAAEWIEGRLAGLSPARDALGSVSVTVGSGSPRRLVACPLGEPGYVVSRIHDDGYLRLIPASGSLAAALWDQSHQGQTTLAKRFPALTRIHPVDTFVSSDSPIETKRFAYTPLGRGPVLRAMDNQDQTPRALIDRFLGIARDAGIPVQYGFTGGASDGLAFMANGPEMLPFSWPGRYSHSPIEVADLRDVEGLVRLVLAAATR